MASRNAASAAFRSPALTSATPSGGGAGASSVDVPPESIGPPGASAGAAGGIASSDLDGSAGPSLIRYIRLFLDERRTEQLVDPPFERGPAVVIAVDRAGQLDERRAKFLPPLAVAKVVFDVPQTGIDRFQFDRQRSQFGRLRKRPARFGEGRQLVAH